MRKRWHVISDFVESEGYTLGVELGVKFGETTSYLLDHFPNLKMIGVDLMKPRNGQLYPGQENYKDWEFDLYKNSIEGIETKNGARFEMLTCSTRDAADTLKGTLVDFVFIDADHSMKGVLEDIVAWRPLVRSGGMLFGHDINWPTVYAAVSTMFRHTQWSSESNDCWFARL